MGVVVVGKVVRMGGEVRGGRCLRLIWEKMKVERKVIRLKVVRGKMKKLVQMVEMKVVTKVIP